MRETLGFRTCAKNNNRYNGKGYKMQILPIAQRYPVPVL
jgi:hypothetical protein